MLSEIAQDRRALSAPIGNVVNSIGDAGAICPEWPPPQSQVSTLHKL